MLLKYCMLLSLLQFAYGLTMCPDECACNTDIKGRLQIICSKLLNGELVHTNLKLFHFVISSIQFLTEGLKTIPVQSLDPNIQVLIISSSKNPLTISPIFIPFTKLEVLQINDANIQSIGVHSFWGVQSLRVLGILSSINQQPIQIHYPFFLFVSDLSRNNISTILANNFRGQDGLHSLDLSFNKIQEMATGLFQHLKV